MLTFDACPDGGGSKVLRRKYEVSIHGEAGCMIRTPPTRWYKETCGGVRIVASWRAAALMTAAASAATGLVRNASEGGENGSLKSGIFVLLSTQAFSRVETDSVMRVRSSRICESIVVKVDVGQQETR